MTNKIYSFMGLAVKAGKLRSGEETCERIIKSGKAELIIIAADASDNTKKKFTDICRYREVDMMTFGEKTLLGRYTGKETRTVIVITEKEFAKQLKEMIKNHDLENGGGLNGKSKSI